MKISDLPPGLKELAEKRRTSPNRVTVNYAFYWAATPEGDSFWSEVNNGNFSVYHGCKVTNLKPK